MAKLQRWKRRSSAGEGSGTTLDGLGESEPVTEVVPVGAGPAGAGKRRGPDHPPPADDSATAGARRRRWSIGSSWPVLLLLAAHPRQAVLTALGVAAAAAVAGRPAREAVAVLATVLVGQTILGWHNDLVDKERDAEHRMPRKPIADGRLDAGTAWYALAIAFLVLVPLSISTGVTAGVHYLAALVIGILGNVMLRRGRFSWVPWALSYALYPFYLSYGGWGGEAEGSAPEITIVVLAALLGIGVHFLRAIWGLVADNEDGWTYLPLKLGLRLGATKLLTVVSAYLAVVVTLLAVAGSTVGLSR